MGQGQSSDGKFNPSEYPEDIRTLHFKAEETREKLRAVKEERQALAKERKEQLKHLEKEKMKRLVTLMKLGKHAQRHISFWEYVRIIRTTFQSSKPLMITNGGESSSMSLNKKPTLSKETSMVKQSDAVHYTIFAFYEAYLLKKLHIAMMLKTQKKLHSKGWNDVVMFLYYEIPRIEASFQDTESNLLNGKYAGEGHLEHVKEVFEDHIRNQQNLMDALESAPKDDAISRDGSASKNSQSGSGGGSGLRRSMFGPSYRSGTKEEYEAPWMKNSRNKLKKSTEKANKPLEEEGEETTTAAETTSSSKSDTKKTSTSSKKKNKVLPKGMPETLEINNSFEEEAKKKAEAAATAAGEEAEKKKEKKKKKKKKKGASSNSSVISELSVGS